MPPKTFVIHPTKKHDRPAPPSAIPLHGYDKLSAPIQIRNHRFFHAPPLSFSEVVDKLKSSLAEALELYPPVNGTVQVDENENPYIAIDTGKGTPFSVDIRDTPYAGDTEDLSARNEPVLPSTASIFAVKVTQFSCGTIAVASSMNHQVTDLRGSLDFLELWATIARGEPIDYSRIPENWCHTPSRFFSGLISNLTKPEAAPPPFTVTATPFTGPAAAFIAPSTVSTWKFSKSSLEQLKRDFSPKDSASWISSGDALSALITGAITRARAAANVARLDGRSSLDSQIERVAMAADGRYRASGETMENGQYFGNFNNLWSADISRADLLSPTLEAGSRVAVAIRSNLKDALSAKSIAKRIAFFEAPENTKPPCRISWGADIILTNWCRFDLQGPSFDLGWGKPFHATPGTGGALPPAYSLMTRGGESGDISVLMTVDTDGGDALKADELLNKYATFQE